MPRGGEHALNTLSNRELQVLRRLALGHTDHEIAEAHGISIKTVDTYRPRLLKKLNLRNNAELSCFATGFLRAAATALGSIVMLQIAY